MNLGTELTSGTADFDSVEKLRDAVLPSTTLFA